MEIEIRLINPQFVVPFVKTNKNDTNDASIVEAASRPTMRFVAVAVKSVEQQNMRAVLRVRELLVHQRAALNNHNQIRGLLSERGMVIAQTPAALKRAFAVCFSQMRRRIDPMNHNPTLFICLQTFSRKQKISFTLHLPKTSSIALEN